MRNFLLLVFLLLSPFALGVRNLMVYTLKSTATAFQSGGADTARLVRVDCENLSSVAQHVKMTLRRQVAYLTLCIENTLGLSGWDTVSGCFYGKQYPSLPNTVVEKTLPASGADEFVFFLSYVFKKSGPVMNPAPGTASDLGFKSDPSVSCGAPANASIKNCVSFAEAAYSYSLEVEVAEDKGAVLCGISASAVLGGAMNPQNSLITQPINGGRPF